MKDEEKINKLENEIHNIKQQRTTLLKQMKEDSKKWRVNQKEYEKQIIQMKKQERKQEIDNMKSKSIAARVQSRLESIYYLFLGQLKERDDKIDKLYYQLKIKNDKTSSYDQQKKKIDIKWLEQTYDSFIKNETDKIQIKVLYLIYIEIKIN